MTAQTFGQALGELILQKRRAHGLTQTQLAEDAYGTSGKTRRISELESGQVANPHPKTIDPIIATLKITLEEIEACAKQVASRPDDDLDRAYREARNLIEAVARQFEHDRPNASVAELDEFLRAKAKEWQALRERIAAMEASDAALSSILADAATALAEGQFDTVDELLALAEERYQNEQTLTEIRKQADIRIARGDSCLLSGRPDAALAHYASAAEYFRPFDRDEMAQVLQEMAYRVYENARQSLTPSFHVASALLELALGLDVIVAHTQNHAAVCYRLSLVLRNTYLANESKDTSAILEKAIKYARMAAAGNDQCDSFQKASTTINLANLLNDRAKSAKYSERSDVAEAIALLEALRRDLRDDHVANELRAHACNSLGAAYLTALDIDATLDSESKLESALDAFRETVEISEQYYDAENWGAAKANIGKVLALQARSQELESYQRAFLRIRAIAEFSAAVETTPVVSYPLHAASIQESLGRILVEHALHLNGPLSELYLSRAIQTFESIGHMLTRQAHPERWARSREWIGSIFAIHAQLEGVSTREADLVQAAAFFEEAAAVFDEIGASEEAAAIRQRARAKQS